MRNESVMSPLRRSAPPGRRVLAALALVAGTRRPHSRYTPLI